MLNKERLVDEFIQMAKIVSPSKKEGNFARYLKKVLEEIGLQVELDDAGAKIGGDTGNIIGKLKGSPDYRPIILSAHMDTVEPCEDIEPVIDGEVIRSKTDTILSADDKGGIAAVVEALRVIQEQDLPHGDIEVVFTICEETGMHGAKNLQVEHLRGEICYIFDCDGKPGTIITQGPAKNVIKATVKGKKAHAGLCPETGISAIQVAAEAVANMQLLRIDPDTTANIGVFHGSTATNVVCDLVEIIAEARSLYNEKLDQQTNHMKECFQYAAEKYHAEADVKVERSYSAFQLNEGDDCILLAKKAIENIGLQPILLSTGGGSDANVLNSKGIPTVDLGIGMTNVHTTEEYIEIEDLVNTTKLILELIRLTKK